ncbi:MAG: SpoIIE family protein phosphatase [Desulforhopalus sp.]|nr:SpoIIE family protein phosphatase [Desulforhopalus sp.]
MKLRWKIFIILLVASLVPMAVVTLFSQKASKELGKSLSAQTQQTLFEEVRREIVSATENYAMITGEAGTSLNFALQLLTLEAGIALSLPLSQPGKVYFAEDFENAATAPDDLAPSPIHMKIMEDGHHASKLISTNYPNFFVPSTVDRAAVQDDITRFTTLSAKLKEIAGKLDHRLFWIFASLESGVHISFPGHGGYPEDYDARLQPWYLQARERGGFSWGQPLVDATTNQLILTASAPFSKPDGSFAGVAGVDVLIPNILLENQISSQWSSNMQSFLVGVSKNPDRKEQEFWILSQKQESDEAGKGAGHSTTGMTLLAEDPDFSKLTQHITSDNVGSLEMPYQGVDSFWAFAEIFPGLHFVIVAPKSMVMELSEEVGKSFSSYIRSQTVISIAAALLVILLVAGMALFVSKINTKDIKTIVSGMKRLEQGDFSVRLGVEFKDERDLIVTTFNNIIPKLEEHLRMSSALGVAEEVQQSLLPGADPTLEGFDIAGTSLYCEETGGDYYDFIQINEERLAVVVGDVSGHGVSSALLMATARALVMLRASMPGPTASIINDVNKYLSRDTYHTGNFMTFFYCELGAMSHEIRWVRAGHDPALIYKPESDEFDELKGKGVAFGLDSTFEYEEFQRTLGLNQIILIGTDGIWEMCNEAGEMFGKEKLKAIIRNNSSATAKEILTMVTVALEDFRGAKHLEDDVTMVVIKVVV